MVSQPGSQRITKTYATQYLTKKKQPDNEICSVNKTLQDKYFSSKIM